MVTKTFLRLMDAIKTQWEPLPTNGEGMKVVNLPRTGWAIKMGTLTTHPEPQLKYCSPCCNSQGQGSWTNNKEETGQRWHPWESCEDKTTDGHKEHEEFSHVSQKQLDVHKTFCRVLSWLMGQRRTRSVSHLTWHETDIMNSVFKAKSWGRMSSHQFVTLSKKTRKSEKANNH